LSLLSGGVAQQRLALPEAVDIGASGMADRAEGFEDGPHAVVVLVGRTELEIDPLQPNRMVSSTSASGTYPDSRFF